MGCCYLVHLLAAVCYNQSFADLALESAVVVVGYFVANSSFVGVVVVVAADIIAVVAVAAAEQLDPFGLDSDSVF